MSEPRHPTDQPDPATEPRDPDMLVGQVISGRYRIDSVIASGAIGNVYEGEHVHMRKRVAIKILNSAMDRLPHVKERFEREAMAGAHIDHPSVGAATDFGRLPDGSYFLVLEFVDGRSLQDAMIDRIFVAQRVVRMGRQLASGLHAAHCVGIIHRDVKPANIMIVRNTDDMVKLIDFGFAKIDFARLPAIAERTGPLPRNVTVVGQVFGTPAYMAPEAATGMEGVDARSDLYALGVTLFEMLAGARPIDDPDPVRLLHRKIKEEAPALSAFVKPGAVPDELQAVIMRLLARDKRDRFASGKELAEALDAIEASCFTSVPYPRSLAPSTDSDGIEALLSQPKSSTGRSDDTAPTVSLNAPNGGPQLQPAAPATGVRRVSRLWWALAAAGLLVVGGSMGAWWTARHAGARPPGTSPSGSIAAPPASSMVMPSASASEAAAESAPQLAAPVPSGVASTEADLGAARTEFWRSVAKRDWKRGARALKAVIEIDDKCFEEVEFVRAAGSVTASVDLIDPALGRELMMLLSERAGGIDVLYDLVLRRGAIGGPGKKALALLQRKAVRARASNGTRLAIELHIGGCPDKRALFDRAGDEGDERVLAELQSLLTIPCTASTQQQPCCFRTDKNLQDAVVRLQARLKQESKDAGAEP